MTDEDRQVAFAKTARDAWESLCRAAVNAGDVERLIAGVAKWTRANPKGVKAKVSAIRAAVLQGKTLDEVIEMGQSECLSLMARTRKAARAGDPDRTLSFRVPRSLADAWQNPIASPDQAEPIITRLHRVCGLETSEDLLDFLKSMLDDLSDEELQQRAGVIPPEKDRYYR